MKIQGPLVDPRTIYVPQNPGAGFMVGMYLAVRLAEQAKALLERAHAEVRANK